MTQWSRTSTVLLGLSLLLASTACLAEDEADNWYDAASVPTDGTRILASFEEENDFDWFKFEAIQGAYYWISLVETTSGMSSWLTLFEYSGEGMPVPIANGYEYDSTPGPDIGWGASKSGEFYIEAGGTPGTYELYVLADIDAQGNTLETAAAIPTDGTWVDGQDNTNLAQGFQDIDYFKFHAIRGVTYVVQVKDRSANMDSAVQVYDRFGQMFRYESEVVGQESMQFSFRAPRTGPTYLAIWDWDPTNGYGLYAISVTSPKANR